MNFKVMNSYFLLSFIAVSLFPTIKTAVTNEEKNIERDYIIKGRTFLRALETFDARNNETFESSCGSLAHAVSTLIRSTDTAQEHGYAATLYVFSKFQKDRFPESGYRVVCGEDTGEDAEIDVMIQRKDGTMFAFKAAGSWGHISLAKELVFGKKVKGSDRFYKGFKRLVRRTIMVGIEFSEGGINFSFLLDGNNFEDPLVIIL